MSGVSLIKDGCGRGGVFVDRHGVCVCGRFWPSLIRVHGFLAKAVFPSLGKRQDPMAVFSSLCLPILAEPRSLLLREDYVQEHATNEEIPSLVLIVL